MRYLRMLLAFLFRGQVASFMRLAAPWDGVGVGITVSLVARRSIVPQARRGER